MYKANDFITIPLLPSILEILPSIPEKWGSSSKMVNFDAQKSEYEGQKKRLSPNPYWHGLFAKNGVQIGQFWAPRPPLYFTDAYRGSPPCTLSHHPDNRETGYSNVLGGRGGKRLYFSPFFSSRKPYLICGVLFMVIGFRLVHNLLHLLPTTSPNYRYKTSHKTRSNVQRCHPFHRSAGRNRRKSLNVDYDMLAWNLAIAWSNIVFSNHIHEVHPYRVHLSAMYFWICFTQTPYCLHP